MNRPLHRLLAGLLVLSVASTARAELILPAAADRERIAAALNRSDVAGELARYGVRAEDARTRIEALSDEEVAAIAGQIDAQPAGGNSGAGLLLLITAPIWLPIAAVALVVAGIVAIASHVNSRSAQ